MPGMVVDGYNPSTGKVETVGFLGTLASQLVSSRLSERFCFKIQKDHGWWRMPLIQMHSVSKCIYIVHLGSCSPSFDTDAS